MERNENKTKKKRKTAIIFASKRNEAKRKQKTAIIFASKRNEAKRKQKTAIIFASKRNEAKPKLNFFRFDAKKVFFVFFCIWSETKTKWSENKMKKAKTSKRKMIKWNSGTICKETKKNINAGLFVFQVYTQYDEKKLKNVYFVSLRSETKQKTFILFRFEAKRTNLKRNEAKWKILEASKAKIKIRSINFALVRSKKFELKAKKKIFFHASVRNGSRFAPFRFEAKKFYLQNRRTLLEKTSSFLLHHSN
jgi:hypothetical protein